MEFDASTWLSIFWADILADFLVGNRYQSGNSFMIFMHGCFHMGVLSLFSSNWDKKGPRETQGHINVQPSNHLGKSIFFEKSWWQKGLWTVETDLCPATMKEADEDSISLLFCSQKIRKSNTRKTKLYIVVVYEKLLTLFALASLGNSDGHKKW